MARDRRRERSGREKGEEKRRRREKKQNYKTGQSVISCISFVDLLSLSYTLPCVYVTLAWSSPSSLPPVLPSSSNAPFLLFHSYFVQGHVALQRYASFLCVDFFVHYRGRNATLRKVVTSLFAFLTWRGRRLKRHSRFAFHGLVKGSSPEKDAACAISFDKTRRKEKSKKDREVLEGQPVDSDPIL